MKKAHIGDVISIAEGKNPYTGGLMGNERRESLRKFKYGEPTPGLAFWYAPWSGGARLITRDEVDWESSGV